MRSLTSSISSFVRPAVHAGRRGSRSLTWGLTAACAIAAMLPFATATAQPVTPGRLADEVPEEFEGADLVNRLGNTVPGDLTFVDETGRTVQLSEFFDGERPVLLTLNYFRCPMLCIETLNGLCDSLMEIDWEPGRDFTMLTVSFDHEEGPDLAASKKLNYLTRYTKPSAETGWHFLTGEQADIERLCEAVGFGFNRVENPDGSYDFAHSSSLIFLDPDGVVTLYMNDVVFEPQDLRFAVVEASNGTVGTWVDNMLLFTCFVYDPDADSYSASILKLMRAGGIVTIVVLVAGIVFMSLRGSRRPSAEATTDEKVVTS